MQVNMKILIIMVLENKIYW